MQQTATEQTVKQWLVALATSNTSSNQDSIKMANLLHRVGFRRAVVVLGIVYLEGKGTLDAPPASIHSIAKMLLKAGDKRPLVNPHATALQQDAQLKTQQRWDKEHS